MQRRSHERHKIWKIDSRTIIYWYNNWYHQLETQQTRINHHQAQIVDQQRRLQLLVLGVKWNCDYKMAGGGWTSSKDI